MPTEGCEADQYLQDPRLNYTFQPTRKTLAMRARPVRREDRTIDVGATAEMVEEAYANTMYFYYRDNKVGPNNPQGLQQGFNLDLIRQFCEISPHKNVWIDFNRNFLQDLYSHLLVEVAEMSKNFKIEAISIDDAGYEPTFSFMSSHLREMIKMKNQINPDLKIFPTIYSI